MNTKLTHSLVCAPMLDEEVGPTMYVGLTQGYLCTCQFKPHLKIASSFTSWGKANVFYIGNIPLQTMLESPVIKMFPYFPLLSEHFSL